MKFNVTHSIISVLVNPTEEEFINEFLKVGNNTCFVATNKRKLQCYVELKEQRPYRISVFQFNSLESEKHFSFSKISETILQTFMSKHSESLGFETKSIWKEISIAPKDGTTIVANYGTKENPETCLIFWSDNPVCMLGRRNGSYPPGWAVSREDKIVDFNLPMDEPETWTENI